MLPALRFSLEMLADSSHIPLVQLELCSYHNVHLSVSFNYEIFKINTKYKGWHNSNAMVVAPRIPLKIQTIAFFNLAKKKVSY